MKATKWRARTRQDLIIEVWEALDCESVGEQELLAIQAELRQTLGDAALISPAAIARELADEGAVLRHPEVLNCDTKWREEQLTELSDIGVLDFGSLDAAAISLEMMETLRLTALREKNQLKLKRLRELIEQCRQEMELKSRSNVVSNSERSMAKEIQQWMSLWIKQPEIFLDWLNLRQRSTEYQNKFKQQR